MSSLWKVTLNTEFGEFGNPIINVFGYYTSLVVIDEANQLMDALEAQLFPALNGIQTDTAHLDTLVVEDPNGTAYGIRTYGPTTYVGTRGSNQAPPFVSWSFKMVKGTRGTRSGGKRIGPISQDDFADRAPAPSVVAGLVAAQTALGAPLMIGLVETWFPVILERPTPPATVWGQHAMSGALFESVSTQNTRKK